NLRDLGVRNRRSRALCRRSSAVGTALREVETKMLAKGGHAEANPSGVEHTGPGRVAAAYCGRLWPSAVHPTHSTAVASRSVVTVTVLVPSVGVNRSSPTTLLSAASAFTRHETPSASSATSTRARTSTVCWSTTFQPISWEET